MGKVTLQIEDAENDQQRFATFSKRIVDFQKALEQRAHYFKLEQLPHPTFFALTLHSPVILCDDLLRYRSTIDAEVLQELLGCRMPGLELIHHAESMQRVTGWQELWGTPRAAEYAIESGSVFLFACSSPLDAKVLEALFALEEKGVGKRCAEGFGRICISDNSIYKFTRRGHPMKKEMQIILEVNNQAENFYEDAILLGDHAAYALKADTVPR